MKQQTPPPGAGSKSTSTSTQAPTPTHEISATPQNAAAEPASRAQARTSGARSGARALAPLVVTAIAGIFGLGAFALGSTIGLGPGPTLGLILALIVATLAGLLAYARARTKAHESSLPRREKAKEAQRRISKAKFLENVGDLGERAAQQLFSCEAGFEALKSVIDAKFSPTEIAHSRYLTAAEQARLGIFDQLTEAVVLLEGLNATDQRELERRHHKLETTAPGSSEAGALRERIELGAQQKKRIESILASNEHALAQMQRVATALGAIQTQRGQASVELQTTLTQLEELAKMARAYDIARGAIDEED